MAYTSNQLSDQYHRRVPNYANLGENLSHIIKDLLKENNIDFLSVEYRVKSFEQFKKKVQRKKYQTPFDEMEDICGVRVICYFLKDIPKIERILRDKFEIVERVNKQYPPDPGKFEYRSYHLIVKIKEPWADVPLFRKLIGLKAEIQLRTVLMHAWAEVEHKLNYKNGRRMPVKFRRKFALLSAKLEEADEQFEELKRQLLRGTCSRKSRK